ncbi:MAG: L-sorbosone dehydrogenase [Planctomycetaceae bacterium]
MKSFARFSIILLFVAACDVQPVFAQRNLKNIPNPDPEIERKSFIVADGFEVNLYASDPRIAKPIQMNFDPQGRLWIASSEVYPHIKPGQKANDKVLVLEDRNGDGKADKTTVFADGLLIPTGVEPGDGGVYVANSTELLHFADTNGDGKADRKRVVLSGFGTEDTHHILHTLRWGPDGMLYMNQSIYIHSHIETPYGVKRLNAGGIWQFRPETMQLEVYARGWVNPWGHQLDEYGQSFVTDGAGGDGINYAVPGASYVTAYGARRILRGLNPGSPKYCGMEIVGGRHLPESWQNNILTNDFRGNRVCRFVIREDGSGFASRQQEDLIKTKHVAFRPIDIKMGPDGAIYIADWYNPIIQHGEVDFRDPRRDHVHGRIWRVTYKGKKTLPRPELVKASLRQLLNHLKSPETWTRHQAKRVLKERGAKAVLPELKKWIDSLDNDDPLHQRHRLEALWVSQSLRSVNRPLLETLLSADDHRVRAAATRVLGHWTAGTTTQAANVRPETPAIPVKDALRLLRQRIHDEHPRVRLEAVRVLSIIPRVESIQIALRALSQPVDRFLDYAMWQTSRDLMPVWLPKVQKGEFRFGGNIAALTFALKSVGSPNVVRPLIDLLKSGSLNPSQQADVLATVASLGGPNELAMVYRAAHAGQKKTAQQTALLNALADAGYRRNVRPSGNLVTITKLMRAKHVKDTAFRMAAIRCAGAWHQSGAITDLQKIATTDSEPLQLRLAAVTALGDIQGTRSTKVLSALIQGEYPSSIRGRAVIALASQNPRSAAGLAVSVLAEMKAGENPADIISAFLQRKDGPAALAAALKGQKLNTDVAKLALRTVSGFGRKQPSLEAALTTAGNVKARKASLTAEEMKAMVAAVENSGDPSRGEAIFRRKSLNCLKCHSIGGSGGKAGPDLVSIGGSAQIDYLVDSLLEPNKKVKENYQTLIVATDSGKVFTGIKVRQTDKDLILRDAEDREISIALNSIEEQVNGKSIMPTGLTDRITQQEFVDLVRFLSQLGKVGKFSVGKERVVRTWRVMLDTPEARFRLRRTSYQRASTDDSSFSWEPVYSQVSGDLPLADLPELKVRNRTQKGSRGVAFVRFEILVTTPGKVGLKLNSVKGLTMWLGEKPVNLSDSLNLDLRRGRHVFTLGVDLAVRKTSLRVELVDVPNSPTVANLVGGK